ncbi:MAG: NifB/NifX family molybdenum-iron cluster-binding protein [Candidatus Heimdallarchaeaceae archaeon]
MILAIPIVEKKEDSLMDSRFGRCFYYLLYDNETSKIEIVENLATHARGGAGIQAVEFLVSKGVGAVIVPEVGPNADRVLRSSKVKIFQGTNISAKELIEKWKKNELKEI